MLVFFIWKKREKNSKLVYTDTKVCGINAFTRKKFFEVDELLINVDITYKRRKIIISNDNGYFEIPYVINGKKHVKIMNEYKKNDLPNYIQKRENMLRMIIKRHSKLVKEARIFGLFIYYKKVYKQKNEQGRLHKFDILNRYV